MKKLKYLLLPIAFLFILQSNSVAQANYNFAAGLRAAWGAALTGKKFINDNAAIEGIVNYRRWSYLSSFNYTRVTVTGVYQYHNEWEDVLEGLSWYYGGGAFVGFYGGSDWDAFDGSDDGSTFIGLVGNIGLDYTFADFPINLSVDWMPGFGLAGYGSGFSGEQGGFAIRYIFN